MHVIVYNNIMYLFKKIYNTLHSFFVWLSCSNRPEIYYNISGLQSESMRHKDNDTGYDNYYDIEYDKNIMDREL